jgi:hypothetical protein
VTPPSIAGARGQFVSDVIVELGFVDAATVERAVENARVSGKSVTALLLEEGVLTDEQLARAIAERHGLDYLDLDELEVDLAAANLVSRADALRYGVVPVAFTEDGALVAAMADPSDPLAVGELSVMTKLAIRPAVATPAAIEALLGRLPAVDEPEESPQPPSDQTPASATGERSGGGTVVWQGQVPAAGGSEPASEDEEAAATVGGPGASDGDRLVAELGARLAQERAADAAEERERSAELEALRARLESLEGVAFDLEAARRETHDLREQLKEREEDLTRATEERDRLAAEREAAEEMAVAAEDSKSELERLRGQLGAAEARASSAEALEAALDQERTDRAGELERHRTALSAVEEELRIAQAAAAAAESLEAEQRRLLTELEGARATADDARRAAEDAQLIADEAERAAQDSSQRAAQLEGADERAERARLALAELRQEREREGELFARTQRELCEELNAQRHTLEQHVGALSAANDALANSIRSITAMEAKLAQVSGGPGGP